MNGNIFLSQNTGIFAYKGLFGKEIIIMAVYDDDRDVTFEIIEEIGIISTVETGWAKELNLVRWNGGVAKYDISEWDNHQGRGDETYSGANEETPFQYQTQKV